MIPINVINDLLAHPWVVLALAVVVVFIGWILGGLLSRLANRMATRVSLYDRLPEIVRFSTSEQIALWIRRLVRWCTFCLGLWLAWRMTAANAEIGSFVEGLWSDVGEALTLPVVVFLYDVALILLATRILTRILRWVRRRFNELARVIEMERGKRLSGWKIQRLQLMSADQATDFLLLSGRYFRYAVNLLLGLLYLMGVFSIFPQTRGVVVEGIHSFSEILANGWKNFVDYLPNFFSLVVVVVATTFGLRLVHFIFREIEKGTISLAGFDPEWAEPTYKIVRVLSVALALVLAFPFLPGSSSPAFQGVSIFIGALISLGSTSVVGNIVAGTILTYAMAFRVGDRVRIADTEGDVVDKGLIATRIRTIKNEDITIPNGIILASHIINYSAVAQQQGLILHTTVTIGYDVPWRAVHEALIRAALATPDILAVPKPFVFQTSLDDSYVSYEINAYTREPVKMAVTYSNLHINIQDSFNEAGIEILSPSFSAVRDGNTITIPPEHRPKDYRPPSFRVKVEGGK
jgi:small-conductance mechanosensitive channel